MSRFGDSHLRLRLRRRRRRKCRPLRGARNDIIEGVPHAGGEACHMGIEDPATCARPGRFRSRSSCRGSLLTAAVVARPV